MYFDAHVHSFVSPDSEMDPKEAIDNLKKQGLGVTFTEHVDFVTPKRGRDPKAADAPRGGAVDFLCDLDTYPSQYRKFRSNSALLGIEFGLTRVFMPLNTQTAEKGDFDFILGSIHLVDGWDIYLDYFKQPGQDHYSRYLTYSREMAELYDIYDSFGHIDYISRYSPFTEKNAWYDLYKNEYDALLKLLAEKGKALEINTSRFGNPELEANLFRIYRRFKELGGKYVTIGSDAHNSERLGRYHEKARKMAEEAGLAPVYYKERKINIC